MELNVFGGISRYKYRLIANKMQESIDFFSVP